MAVLGGEEFVMPRTLARLGVSNVEIARTLGVTEGTVRYQRRRLAADASDGRAKQPFLASPFREVIDAYLEARGEKTPSNVQDLHEFLVAEYGYAGSLRSVQRFVRATFPPPPVWTWRRVEVPPGAQGQADWAVFPRVPMGGGEVDLVAFVLLLSFSRADAIVWSDRRDLPSWLGVHLGAFARFEGVPATVRVDNEKTAVVRGAGAWGTVHPAYRRFGQQLRFHADACAPRAPEAKGKVERRIRDARRGLDPYRQRWREVSELQPFDVAVRRRVGIDATVRFEGRTYTVPFELVERAVVLHGTRAGVQVYAGATLSERSFHPLDTPAAPTRPGTQ